MSAIKLLHRLFAGSRSDMVRQKDAALIRALLNSFESNKALPFVSESSDQPMKLSTKHASLTASEERSYQDLLKRIIHEGYDAVEAQNSSSVNRQINMLGQAMHDALSSEGDPLIPERHSAVLYDKVYRFYWGPQGSATRDATRGLGLAYGSGDTSYDTSRRILDQQGQAATMDPTAPERVDLTTTPEALQFYRPADSSSDPSAVASSSSSSDFVSKARLRELLVKRLGFSLETKRSSIDHENAGMGLFLQGRARKGQVLGFYPGVVFLPQWHHYVPGFPCPDLENVYLLGRYDRALIDGRSWGCGALDDDPTQVEPIGWPSTFFDTENMGPIFEAIRSYMAKRSLNWEALRDRYWDIRYDWRFVDLRNPLAAFHFANHPPKGTAPNVVKVPFEFDPTADGLPKWLRAYVPFLMYQAGAEVTREGRNAAPHAESLMRVPYKGGTVRGMACIAARDLSDEELFLDYRLNTTAMSGRPGWYHPVSGDSDWRWQFHSAVGLGGVLGIREDVDDLAERLRDLDSEAAKKRYIL